MLFTKADRGKTGEIGGYLGRFLLLVLLDIINSVKKKKTQTVSKLKNDRDQPRLVT